MVQGHGQGGNRKRGRGDENLGHGDGNSRGKSRVRRNQAVKVVNGKLVHLFLKLLKTQNGSVKKTNYVLRKANGVFCHFAF